MDFALLDGATATSADGATSAGEHDAADRQHTAIAPAPAGWTRSCRRWVRARCATGPPVCGGGKKPHKRIGVFRGFGYRGEKAPGKSLEGNSGEERWEREEGEVEDDGFWVAYCRDGGLYQIEYVGGAPVGTTSRSAVLVFSGNVILAVFLQGVLLMLQFGVRKLDFA